MIKKLDETVFSNDEIVFVNEDSGNVTFSSDGMGILGVDLNNVNPDDVNFNEDDPKTIFHVRLMTWRNKFKQHKAYKKDVSKELKHGAWHLTRWWDWCKPEDEKRKIKRF